jgi:RNA polymerase sigma factor (sigma-70 family)
MLPPLGDLLRAARLGDEAARERLLREIYPEVAKIVHRALETDFRRRHRWILAMFSTGDIVQDVFLNVVRAQPEAGAADERQLLSWLATQVQNRIIDRVRFHLAQRRDARHATPLADGEGTTRPVAAPDLSPSGLVSLDERARLVLQALGELGEREQELWRLRVDEEKSFSEVAHALHLVTEESARSAFRRVRSKLALRLHRLGVRGVVEVTEP